MKDEKIESRHMKATEDRYCTEKDLKILELTLLNEMNKIKSYLMTRVGAMLVGGFSIIGFLISFRR